MISRTKVRRLMATPKDIFIFSHLRSIMNRVVGFDKQLQRKGQVCHNIVKKKFIPLAKPKRIVISASIVYGACNRDGRGGLGVLR